MTTAIPSDVAVLLDKLHARQQDTDTKLTIQALESALRRVASGQRHADLDLEALTRAIEREMTCQCTHPGCHHKMLAADLVADELKG